jgi:hypothetical protein
MTTWFDMIQHDLTWFNMIQHDLTWIIWFDMNDMIWHEWHDLTWMTWFDPNYTNDMNSKIWHELHDLTWFDWHGRGTYLFCLKLYFSKQCISYHIWKPWLVRWRDVCSQYKQYKLWNILSASLLNFALGHRRCCRRTVQTRVWDLVDSRPESRHMALHTKRLKNCIYVSSVLCIIPFYQSFSTSSV